MVSDMSLEELDSFAARIGLKREWRQGTKPVHYDVSGSIRRRALELGAVEVSSEDLLLRGHDHSPSEDLLRAPEARTARHPRTGCEQAREHAPTGRVVHVLQDEYDTYIDRAMTCYGSPASVWANPYRPKRCSARRRRGDGSYRTSVRFSRARTRLR
jgi:hypothetical protein